MSKHKFSTSLCEILIELFKKMFKAEKTPLLLLFGAISLTGKNTSSIVHPSFEEASVYRYGTYGEALRNTASRASCTGSKIVAVLNVLVKTLGRAH